MIEPAAMPSPNWLTAARIALHPLSSPPKGPPLNSGDLDDLLPTGQPLMRAAVLVALIERDAGVQVLFTRRTDHLSRHAGQISFPGGRIDAGDADAVAAAVRETHEEVRVDPKLIEPIGFLDLYDTITAFRVQPVVARLDASYVADPDPREVAEVFEVPLAFLLDPDHCERVSGEFRGRLRHYYQFRFGTHLIWGATAAMLLNLRQRLRAEI